MPPVSAAVFMSGNSQAIRLPKSFRINSARVTLEHVGDAIVIREAPMTMEAFLAKLPAVTDWPDAPADEREDDTPAW